MRYSPLFYGNQHIGKIKVTGEKKDCRKDSFISRMFKSVKRIAIALAIIVLGASAVSAGYMYADYTIKPEKVFAKDTSMEIFQTKIEIEKEKVLDSLMDCERSIYKESDGLVTYDPRESMKSAQPTVANLKKILSYGVLQFKIGTVQYYEKMRSGKILSDKEAITLAFDAKEARALAKFVGFETKSKFSGDWKTCSARYNLDAKVDIIKAMEK